MEIIPIEELEKVVAGMLKGPREENLPLGIDDALLKDGRLDSMAILNLITLLEEKYNIVIEGDDFTEENFQSVRSIHSLLTRLNEGQRSL